MATFSDIKETAERISYQISYLEQTKQTLEDIMAEERSDWYALYVCTGDGSEMKLYDVPKDEIARLVQEYRINKLESVIEAGKKEIAEMAVNVEY